MSGKRNYGVDLLRIILMILIIIGHLYAHTEIRSQLPFLSIKWCFTWATQSLTVCAVNCFVIITGYYMSNSKFDLFRLVKLWTKVIFYSALLTIILCSIKEVSISAGSALDAFFPVFRQEYWFFTMYILLYLLIPFLNAGLNRMTKKKHSVLVIVILIFFYIEPLFSVVFYEYDVTEGFSLVAFVTLYIIGAYLARCQSIPKKHCVCIIIGSCLLMLISKITLEMIVVRYGLNFGTGLLYHNNSIFVLINAIALFELFKQINLNVQMQKAVVWISPSVFSVYLLHEKPAMRKVIWNDQLLSILKDSGWLVYCIIVIGIGIGLFAIGLVVDKFFVGTMFKIVERSNVTKKVKELCEKYDSIVNI